MNSQNIPVRSEDGKKIRRAFVARPGYKMLSGDFSQIEIRVLAHNSSDEHMIRVLCENGDVHTETASEIFGVLPEQVTKAMRDPSKNVTFATIYQAGVRRLGETIRRDMTEEDAARALGVDPNNFPRDGFTVLAAMFQRAFFRRYPGVPLYIEDVIRQARRDGYVSTLYGRRRSVPGIWSSDSTIKHDAEKIAVNTPIQGTAGDIIKMAMITVRDVIKQEHLRIFMINQIHDELLFEVHEDDLVTGANIIHDVMVNSAKLAVPIKVDIEVGDNWGDVHDFAFR